jgi:hypothetical protein
MKTRFGRPIEKSSTCKVFSEQRRMNADLRLSAFICGQSIYFFLSR